MFDGVLAQVMGVNGVDDSHQKRQKVYKSLRFAKAVLILEVGNTTKASELALNEATT